MVEASGQSSTFQVINLPIGTTDEAIEEIFSEFGPLKRCFVVKQKLPAKTDKTTGYVQFAFNDDAIKASKV
jgi:nucleolar protein 4